MTYQESIPIAKQLAERALLKGFDTEAFLVLTLLNKQDMIPDSNVDEQISDIGKIFFEYYNSQNEESLDKLMVSFKNVLTEIYNTMKDSSLKNLFKIKLNTIISSIEQED